MPAATPVPRGPTLPVLYTAADLLTGPGCPVCRYAGESSDRYLAWFALEAHADTVTVTRLCSSLGMCPRHTRALMRQPGAARRLTAVYRYLMRAARDQLSGYRERLASCPACEHDDGATRRALETLLEGLADDGPVRDRYLSLGGLCLPHLQSAPGRGSRQVIAWLAQAVTAAVSAGPASSGWLAGTDHDAAARVALRQAASRAGVPAGPDMCVACLASARAEHNQLARMARCGDGQPDPGLVLCAGHLGDLIVPAGQRTAAALLTWQAASLVTALTGRPAARRPWKPGGPAGWLRPWRAGGQDGCAVCLSAADAARQAIGSLLAQLPAADPIPGRQVPLCVRHLLGLAAAVPSAGKIAVPAALGRADALIAELDEAFGKGTWARRDEPRGQEMTAWRRAAAFLDGSVFCGCSPEQT